jgi:hypothetical protein
MARRALNPLAVLARRDRIGAAIRHLREARDSLRLAGADKAADYVARALKSTEGAYRHARHLEFRSQS